MSGKRKSFVKRGGQSGEMSLQITAMADIFVVLLVFLLKGYASGAVNISPSAGLVLPSAQADAPADAALKLEVSETAVQVEGKPVANLTQFEFDKKDMNSNGTVKSLAAALEKERKRQLLIAQANPDVKVVAKVIVIADQRAPYSTIKSVLASAAVNGFTDFKLAVIKEE